MTIAESPYYIIDGIAEAELLRRKLMLELTVLKRYHNVIPGLAVIQVGDNSVSAIYVRKKLEACQELGITSYEYKLDANIQQRNLISKIESLNNNPRVHGILIQLPLPDHIDAQEVMNKIDTYKDVDGLNVENIGKLAINEPDTLVPCTPQGCMYILSALQREKILADKLAGYKVVIVGRSSIVGRPMAQMLLNADCTVTVTHSKTRNLAAETSTADILIVSVGKPEFIKAEHVKKGAVVIDVGINRVVNNDGRVYIKGDVDFTEVAPIASAITPVPGGVGPMTIASLLYNTMKAACLVRNIAIPGQGD